MDDVRALHPAMPDGHCCSIGALSSGGLSPAVPGSLHNAALHAACTTIGHGALHFLAASAAAEGCHLLGACLHQAIIAWEPTPSPPLHAACATFGHGALQVLAATAAAASEHRLLGACLHQHCLGTRTITALHAACSIQAQCPAIPALHGGLCLRIPACCVKSAQQSL